MDHQVKSVNTDSRSRKRFRFTSSKQRSKKASADVYRSYKRRIGVTSAASREERVHHTHREESKRAKKRQKTLVQESVQAETQQDDHDEDKDDEDVTEATFSEELDLAYARNPSEIFCNLYREIWPLARSLPEVLHHSSAIVTHLLDYLLSHEEEPHLKSLVQGTGHPAIASKKKEGQRVRFVVNHATTDVLHLLAVLAKDLRHEIHPFLHKQIIPRIINDLLNQPTTTTTSTTTTTKITSDEDRDDDASNPPSNDDNSNNKKQVLPVDVSIIEAAFRCLSYIFRYDAEALLAEATTSTSSSSSTTTTTQEEPCLELLRQYYGPTLAHKRELVRRLAAETFAPLVRKLKHDAARKKHLRRVLRALILSQTTKTQQQQNATASAIKLQNNAIDGISHFFFEVSRGITGKIHSKGKVAFRVLFSMLSSCSGNGNGLELVHFVATAYLDKLYQHTCVQRGPFVSDVLHDLIRTTQRVIQLESTSSNNKDDSKDDENNNSNHDRQGDFGPQGHMIKLILQTVRFREGVLLHDVRKKEQTHQEEGEEDQAETKFNTRQELIKIVLKIVESMVPNFADLPHSLQDTILDLISTTWKSIPNDARFASKLKPHIQALVNLKPNQNLTIHAHPAIILAQHVMPFLPAKMAMGIVGTAMLSAAAAAAAETDQDLCLALVLAVATTQISIGSETMDDQATQTHIEGEEDSLFSLQGAAYCQIAIEHKQTILDAFMLRRVNSKEMDANDWNRIGVATRCIAFVAFAAADGKQKDGYEEATKQQKETFEKVSKWLLKVITTCDDDGRAADDKHEEAHSQHVIVAALALESLSRLSMEFHKRWHESSAGSATKSIKKALGRAQAPAERLLHANPTSHWALKGIAAYVQALGLFRIVLTGREEVFDALVINLSSSSHFRRLYSLQILVTFPKMPFVTDHADLDLTDDLDEEYSEAVPNEDTASTRRGVVRSGLCDIIETLLSIESAPISFENERPLVSLISKVEVMGRSAKIPVVYAEAVANHMLGLLYIKFSPIWPAAVAAFVSLANGQEFPAWSPLKEKLDVLMSRVPSAEHHPAGHSNANCRMKQFDVSQHQKLCAAWDQSNGEDVALFGKETSQYLPTDEATVLQHAWSVLESATLLLTKHSRQIVPIFLRFMHAQFYSFYPHDPDARELRIEEHIEEEKRFDRTLLKGHIVHQRLVSILKVFAAVKGPKQLYKHSLLLSVFTALLGQETQTAQLAFGCIEAYNLPFMTLFSEELKALFARGGLREALLKFTTALENRSIDVDHRRQLIPLIVRVLFGRLSARGGGSKSSKDSPSARRAAVLSFLSVLCQNDGELYPLIYLMIRNYVPIAFSLVPVEQQDEAARREALIQVEEITVDELALLPTQVHIGFLHLLEPVLHQLGHRVATYVTKITHVVLRLCKFAEVKQVASPVSDALDDSPLEEEEAEGKTRGFGSVRTLCFRRLAAVFSQFSAAVDLSAFGSMMWESTERSVSMLPATVVRGEKVPALLSLMQTLSSSQPLLSMLRMNDEAVPCVIKCLSDTSCHPVVDSVLMFIDNLLNGCDGDASSYDLICPHVPLVLVQFTTRLGTRTTSELDGTPGRNGKKVRHSITWRRELRILYRITELVEEAEAGGLPVETSGSDVADKLCMLLIPYLDHGHSVTEADRLSVLKILERLIAKVSDEAAMSYFDQFSRLLGPGAKGKPGIVSYPVRNGISSVLSNVPLKSTAEASRVVTVLRNLCKNHSKRVDELDYDAVIPCLNALVDGESTSSWRSMATTNRTTGPKLIAPVICTCFHYLYNDDTVVARGAFKSLKGLIGTAADLAGLKSVVEAEDPSVDRDPWIQLLEKTLLPAVRNGLTARIVSVRRLYILLMAAVADSCRNTTRPNLYGDLSLLIRDDEPDLDFFANITHLQTHRRTKAFQRLRKVLSDTNEQHNPRLSLHSLSNVLLPLALHPVYESKTKAEEAFAIEAIASVGAISRHLSWNKYSSTLWTTLTQFERHPQQERYLVGLICALIDGFHFEISETDSEIGASAVWRTLEKRFIPRIESLLSKENVDQRSGSKTKTLRASLILALVNLFKRFSRDTFEARLPRLLTVICDGLKSRESDARDIARNTLAKVAAGVGIEYLPDILRELTLALNDGFRLHVRMATVHSILLQVGDVYKPSPNIAIEAAANLAFDRSVPGIMDIVQQDLFGAAQERKDAEGVRGRFVKEAAGSKSQSVIELTSSLITFRPSVATQENQARLPCSSIHAMTSPLVERLKLPNVDIATIRRVRECLSRIVTGLGKNPSVSVKNVLPFVYATAAPFIGDTNFAAPATDVAAESSDEDDPMLPIRISGQPLKRRTDHAPKKSGGVAQWRPSSIRSSNNSKEASMARLKESKQIRRVQDGASAPKLTGSARYSAAVGKSRINEPAHVSAVVFSLRLLYSTWKKQRAAVSEASLVPLVDPFVPLLTACVCTCRETEVLLLALRCLGMVLVVSLPSKDSCAIALGSKTLELLASNGVGANQDNEMSQACFKILVLLINFDPSSFSGKVAGTTEMIQRGEEALAASRDLPLDSEQMKVLLSLLQESIMDSENHNSAMSLIKAIMGRRFASTEFYELMEAILELSVRSPKATLRQHCAGIVVNFLLNYPMGEERLEQHLKQIILNLKYQFEAGRLSGISLATTVIEKVPEPVLQKYVQLFFLPLTMQLVNDDSEQCRKGVAKCLMKLLLRLPIDIVQSLYDYAVRWSQGDFDVQRASLHLFGILVDARPDFLRRGDIVTSLLGRLRRMLTQQNNGDQSDWELFYRTLMCLEKLAHLFPKVLANEEEVWEVVIRCLAHSHPFIKMVSSRLVHKHLQSLDPAELADAAAETFLASRKGSLYEIARNLCFQLNSEEEHQNEEIIGLNIKSLCWVLPAMQANPTLCYSDAYGDVEGTEKVNPVGWVLKRLSSAAKPKGPKRRQAIFKAFAAFATLCPDVVFPHLELMLEPLHRVDVETANDAENPSVLTKQQNQKNRKGTQPEGIPAEASLARDVLQLLEDVCSRPDVFLTVYAAVKTKAREKRENRKLMIQSEAVQDPQKAAKRRLKTNERQKRRKKRRIEERRMGRGGVAKKSRHHDREN